VTLAARITQLQAFMALNQMLVMPLFFLSGAMYPRQGLPPGLTVVTRFDPLTYVVAPMRKAVFSHLDVTPAAARALDPGISWNAGRVPNSLALGLAAVIGLALLGLAIAQFRKTE
jgi:ABC-2 type transport system permease protein